MKWLTKGKNQACKQRLQLNLAEEEPASIIDQEVGPVLLSVAAVLPPAFQVISWLMGQNDRK